MQGFPCHPPSTPARLCRFPPKGRKNPFVLVPRTFSQPSNLPCPKEGFNLNPKPLCPLQGRGLTQEIAARRRFPSVLVSRDTACIIYRLAHRVIHYLFLRYAFSISVCIFCFDAHSLCAATPSLPGEGQGERCRQSWLTP